MVVTLLFSTSIYNILVLIAHGKNIKAGTETNLHDYNDYILVAKLIKFIG